MIKRSTDHYDLTFYDTYVIAEAKENTIVTSRVTEEILQVILAHFEGRSFTVISHRKNNYSIKEDAYSPKLFKKVLGMAVVSGNPTVKEKAINEQLQFRNSFAFFENLEDAQSWALSVKED